MKYISLLIIITTVCLSQDTSRYVFKTLPKKVFADASVESTNKIIITNNSGKKITLDFNGDTLKTYGNLHLDSASAVFFEYCMKRWLNYRREK